MIKNITAAAAVACLAGAASADGQFNLLGTIDASANPAAGGQPISTSGEFYQNVSGTTNGGPNENLIDVVPDIQFDSYFAIDGANGNNGSAGPSGYGASDSTATPAAGSGADIEFTDASTLDIGSAFGTPGEGVVSASDWAGAASMGGEAVFFARLTTDGDVSAPEVRFNLDDGEGDGTLAVTINGIGLENGVEALGQTFSIINLQSDSPQGTVNDLYLTNVPTPGAAAVLGLAGFVATRRRRA